MAGKSIKRKTKGEKQMNVSFSLTDSPSLFLRIQNKKIDIHFEFFYKARSNPECFLSAYKGEKTICKNCGSLEEIVFILNKLIPKEKNR